MNKHKALGGKKLVDAIILILQEKKAEEIVIIDLHAGHGTSDFFIICQADNTAHTHAIAEDVIKSLKTYHTYPWHQEGLEDGRWILIDYTDVVVHIMLPELRSYYDLESLWSEGEISKIPSQS